MIIIPLFEYFEKALKTTVLVCLFQCMPFIWSLNNSNFFTQICRISCPRKRVVGRSSTSLLYKSQKKVIACGISLWWKCNSWAKVLKVVWRFKSGGRRRMFWTAKKVWSWETGNISWWKKKSQNPWESHKQLFQNVYKQPETFEIKLIGCHMSWQVKWRWRTALHVRNTAWML